MNKPSYFALLTIASLALSSCNTFIGAGRDLQKLGSGMENKGTTGDWNGTGGVPNVANPSNPYGVPTAR